MLTLWVDFWPNVKIFNRVVNASRQLTTHRSDARAPPLLGDGLSSSAMKKEGKNLWCVTELSQF